MIKAELPFKVEKKLSPYSLCFNKTKIITEFKILTYTLNYEKSVDIFIVALICTITMTMLFYIHVDVTI